MQSMNVLIIEDDGDISFMLKDILKEKLKENNLSIDIVENGKEAASLVQNKNYDLLLLDIHMPIMNGIEFLKNFGEHVENTPIVVVTSTPHLVPQKDNRYRIVISKPFSYEDFAQKIDHALKHV